LIHADRARTNPNGLALDDGTRQLTWGELDDRVNRLVHWIHALGAKPGDHVATLMETTPRRNEDAVEA